MFAVRVLIITADKLYADIVLYFTSSLYPDSWTCLSTYSELDEPKNISVMNRAWYKNQPHWRELKLPLLTYLYIFTWIGYKILIQTYDSRLIRRWRVDRVHRYVLRRPAARSRRGDAAVSTNLHRADDASGQGEHTADYDHGERPVDFVVLALEAVAVRAAVPVAVRIMRWFIRNYRHHSFLRHVKPCNGVTNQPRLLNGYHFVTVGLSHLSRWHQVTLLLF